MAGCSISEDKQLSKPVIVKTAITTAYADKLERDLAIGAGLLIAEIQQPSDTTYRVFDWNRVDDRGQAIYHSDFRLTGSDLSAEDAVQQTLVTIWKELPRLRDASRFDAWSYRVLTRVNGNINIPYRLVHNTYT